MQGAPAAALATHQQAPAAAEQQDASPAACVGRSRRGGRAVRAPSPAGAAGRGRGRATGGGRGRGRKRVLEPDPPPPAPSGPESEDGTGSRSGTDEGDSASGSEGQQHAAEPGAAQQQLQQPQQAPLLTVRQQALALLLGTGVPMDR